MLTIISFILFTGLVGFFSWYFTRRSNLKTNEGYFLAGRSLSFPVIAGSLLLTNLSTEQMVGLNGAAFKDGFVVMAWEVLAVLALIVMALFLLPKFLKSGIATVPEFLQIRFDKTTQTITNIIFLVAYVGLLLPIILYTGAVGLIGVLDIKSLTGIQSDTQAIWLIVWGVGIIGSIYALSGGLRIVAVSDTINSVGLLLGGLLIPYFGLQIISGGEGVLAGWQMLNEKIPEKMQSVGDANTSIPFSTLFTGVMLLHLFYWCTNQQIIQRTLGAKSLQEGQKGVLLTGGLKLLGPLYLVLPGVIAFYLYADQGIKADNAYGVLVQEVLPSPLAGVFAAVLFGAIMSSFNSALNSTCTLFSLEIYKYVKKDASEAQVIRSGKSFGIIVTLFAMIIAPLLANTGSIFSYLQKMNGMYFIPIFSVIILSLLYKKMNPLAAKIGLVTGFLIIAIGYFVPPFTAYVEAMHEFHFVGAVFVTLILLNASY